MNGTPLDVAKEEISPKGGLCPTVGRILTMTNVDIIVAESAGFCCGVQRAFDIAVSAAREHGKAYTLGELVHNDDAVRILEQNNVFAISDLSDCPEDGAIVIRSHGVGRAVCDALESSGRTYFDATCEYVKKIHEIVCKADPKTHILIAGDESHPEVRGIVGHVNGQCSVVNSPEELAELVRLNENIRQNAQIFVAQTTFNVAKWRDCVQIIKKHCTNAKIFGTICNATIKRQNQARELSLRCDTMVVIGSNRSSNSVKLYEICSENCGHTFLVPNAEALSEIFSTPEWNIGHTRSASPRNAVEPLVIAVTAGASVPTEIIREVHEKMSSEVKDLRKSFEDELDQAGLDFLAEVEKTLPQKLYTGKRVKAFVVAIHANEVVVDLGVKQAGYIPADEIGGEPGSTPDMVVKVGDEIDCIVTKVNDAEGYVYLSKKDVDSELGYEKLTVAYNADAVLEGYVAAVVNSGVIVVYEGTRVFVPASQSGVPRGGDLESLLKKTVPFKVIEVNEQRKRLVGSIRAASRMENDAAKNKFWEEIEIGKKFRGEVKSIESYGVFVDLGGVDGMVHLSELSWKRIKHPKDAVQLGDTLDVFVKNYDPDRRRVSLCAKNPDDNPWTKFANEYEEGSVVKATIVNITPFGAFAQIIPGIDGLIHISQISGDRVKNVGDALKVGEEVEVQITEIDEDRERVSISMKALIEEESEVAEVEAEHEVEAEEVAEVAEVAE
jgi:4-hydroxy-3-methylbut-2-enyl diphosphate reductase